MSIQAASAKERLIKVYFRHNCVRVVLKNLLTYSVFTNFLRAPLPRSDENILLIRRSLTRNFRNHGMGNRHQVSRADLKFQAAFAAADEHIAELDDGFIGIDLQRFF